MIIKMELVEYSQGELVAKWDGEVEPVPLTGDCSCSRGGLAATCEHHDQPSDDHVFALAIAEWDDYAERW